MSNILPALQRDIVVMDNLASHKVKDVKEAVGQGGAIVRYLPAYSPDLNPIEKAFAKLGSIQAGSMRCACSASEMTRALALAVL
jgi:transposase